MGFLGINGVTFFAVSILSSSEQHTKVENVGAIILASTQVVASFISTFFVEMFGRKFLLLVSSGIVGVAGICLGAYFFIRDTTQLIPTEISAMPWIPLSLLMLFVFGFALGLGPVTWILIAEILPQETRHLLNPTVIAINWLCTFAVTSTFPWLRQEVNLHGIFWIYAGNAVLGMLFTLAFIPETKGKNQSQIQELFIRQDKNRSHCLPN
jgi:MFS family permease